MIAALDDIPPEDVVVFGHSVAGLCLPVIGARGPFRRIVFLCAVVPSPGQSYRDYLSDPANRDAVTMPPHELDEQGRLCLSVDDAHKVFWADVDEEIARSAWEKLVPTAFNSTPFNEVSPVDTWPDVLSSYVPGTEDQVIGQTWSRRVSLQRLSEPAVEVPGSHSPMLSRSRELAAVLDELARA